MTKLRLQFVGHRRGTLADGSITWLKVYLANLVWHARTKDVLILQAEGKPLIGMSLLEGNHLSIDVAEGGKATIDELG